MRSETSKKILSETPEETRQKVNEETKKHLSKMKTIKEWLQELPEPYRAEAIENYNSLRQYGSINTCYSLPDALLRAFSWMQSNQGHEYWRDLFNKLRSE